MLTYVRVPFYPLTRGPALPLSALSITRTMNPQLLMIPTAARIVEETEETAPPPARQIQWAPMAFSEQESVCPATRPHPNRTPAKLALLRLQPSASTRTSQHAHARAYTTHARSRSRVHARTYTQTRTRSCSISGSSVDSPRSQKEKWEEILEKSWIKLRPHASVPIAEETRKTQEQFFPLTLTSYEYVAKPIAEETAASDEVTPSAGKTIGKIKAPTISKQISKPVC